MEPIDLTNPILNSPYAPRERHFGLGPDGPTGEIVDGRRPSESFIPVPRPKKGSEQQTLDFDITGERREENSLINDIRFEVERWRARGYPVPVHVVSARLGHSSPVITLNVYAHVLPTGDEQAAKALAALLAS